MLDDERARLLSLLEERRTTLRAFDQSFRAAVNDVRSRFDELANAYGIDPSGECGASTLLLFASQEIHDRIYAGGTEQSERVRRAINVLHGGTVAASAHVLRSYLTQVEFQVQAAMKGTEERYPHRLPPPSPSLFVSVAHALQWGFILALCRDHITLPLEDVKAAMATLKMSVDGDRPEAMRNHLLRGRLVMNPYELPAYALRVTLADYFGEVFREESLRSIERAIESAIASKVDTVLALSRDLLWNAYLRADHAGRLRDRKYFGIPWDTSKLPSRSDLLDKLRDAY